MTTTPTKPAQQEAFILPELIVTGSLSPESQEVIQHFGLEAPYLLNQYCCSVEDALIEQVQKVEELRHFIDVLVETGRENGVELLEIIQSRVSNEA